MSKKRKIIDLTEDVEITLTVLAMREKKKLKPYCEEILTQFAEATKGFDSNGFAKAKGKNKINK
jgi:hypothetical protein